MQAMIKADDSDLITVHADDFSSEQLTIRLELEGPAYGASAEVNSLTLTTQCARDLARALLQSADMVELNARRLGGNKHCDLIAFNSAAARLSTHRQGNA
jgi:hypothetical protein